MSVALILSSLLFIWSGIAGNYMYLVSIGKTIPGVGIESAIIALSFDRFIGRNYRGRFNTFSAKISWFIFTSSIGKHWIYVLISTFVYTCTSITSYSFTVGVSVSESLDVILLESLSSTIHMFAKLITLFLSCETGNSWFPTDYTCVLCGLLWEADTAEINDCKWSIYVCGRRSAIKISDIFIGVIHSISENCFNWAFIDGSNKEESNFCSSLIVTEEKVVSFDNAIVFVVLDFLILVFPPNE